jgi:DNA-binding PadR family transcriptional regulator
LQVLRKGIDDTKTTKSKDSETGDTIIRQREVKRTAMSVVEIVKRSEEIEYIEPVTKNQVYHHLPKLMDAGYVIKLGTVTTGKRTTDYYRRTAGGFVLATSVMSAADEKMVRKKSSKMFEKLDQHFKLDLTDEEQKEFEELRFQALKIELDARKEIVKMIRSDIADKDVLDMYEYLLQMFALGDEKYIEIHKKIRELIFK